MYLRDGDGGGGDLKRRLDTYPAFSSSSSFDPEPVFVGRSSSGIILEPLLLLLSIVVSANRFDAAIFSIILPPAVI